MNPKEIVCHSGLPMSQSSIACGMRCERCWFLRHRWHLKRTKRKFNVGMDLGTIYHMLMKEGQGREAVVKDCVRQKQAFYESQIANGEDLDDSIAQHVNDLTSLYHKAECMATIYWRKYPRNDNRETLVREEKMTVDDVEGTIDELELFVPSGQTTIRDTKTTGKSLAHITTGYKYGLQLRVYRFLAEEWCRKHGYPVPLGFIIDSVLMPNIKLCKKDDKEAKIQGCTPEEAYLIRVEQWYEDNLRTSMASTPLPFDEPVITEELDNAFETIRELAARDPKPENYKRDVTRSYCMAWDRQCSFYPLCNMKPSMWPVELDDHYEIWESEHKGEL